MPKRVTATPSGPVKEAGLAGGPYVPTLAETVTTVGPERRWAAPHELAWWDSELERLALRAELAAHDLL